MSVMRALEKPLVNGPFAWFHRSVMQPRMLRLSGPLAGDVLEVGCGVGATTEGLLGPDIRVTAIDLDPEQVAKARRRLGLRAEVSVGDVTALAFPDASFDVVVEMNVLHHVEHWSRALREVHRVLKPGGRFFFMDYTTRFAFGALARPGYQDGRFVRASFLDGLAAAGFVDPTALGSWVIFGHASRSSL